MEEKGLLMRTRIGWLVWLVPVVLFLAPAAVRGQQPNGYYYVPPSDPPNPVGLLSHSRYESGGFYFASEFWFLRETNPLRDQVVAARGFVDVTGQLTGNPGQPVGSFAPALLASDASGPNSYMPGVQLTLGYRLENGVSVEGSWLHLVQARYPAQASIIPQNFVVAPDLSNTFLFSPVYNFPGEFRGQPTKVNGAPAGSIFGIWNGAALDQIIFTQRLDFYDFTMRVPVYQTDCDRCYGLLGPRLVSMWEQFKWRAVSADLNLNSVSTDAAIYRNTLSQRMYGVHVGGGYERYWGTTPIGGFSGSIDAQVALYINLAKERASYELGDRSQTASRNRNTYTLVPGGQVNFNIWYYPIDGIQMRVGYNALGFFNTIASREPVDFNYGALAPGYSKGFTRFVDGLNAGIAFIF
jgi:hypothetical protein